ncbi:nodulin-related protein 1 [Alnus glutinosa]|uniref:nodulin-related protein 1 n=1 Tax=Alnus glutinosa TaxID=3517 RepID=UPI002D783215|nr:nodulin-related protein 1 [Alnus glutinosa]
MDQFFQSDSHKKPTTTTTHPQKHHQPSNSELLASAKLVAEAAQASMGNETNKVDKARVAGAAADLLEAASHYGKLEDKSFGKYIDQAETYLHQYNSSHSSTTTGSSGHSASHADGGDGHSAHSGSGYGDSHSSGHSASTTSHADSGDGHSSHSGSGGYGDYLKMAQGFLKK